MKHTTNLLPITLALSLAACASARGVPPTATAPQPIAASPTDSGASDVATEELETRTKQSTYIYLEVPLLTTEFSSTPIVAVEDEVITVRDLLNGLGDSAAGTADHNGHGTDAQGEHHGANAHANGHGTDAHTGDAAVGHAGDHLDTYEAVLERLINTRLMLVEARAMGLDEKPELAADLAKFEENLLRTMVRNQALEDVVADPAEVEEIYKDMTRRWRVRSALHETEVGAKAFRAEAAASDDIDATFTAWIDDGRARGSEAPDEVEPSTTLPVVAKELDKLATGELSPVVRVPEGYVVVHLDSVTYVDDPAARAQATKISLDRQSSKALRAHFDSLCQKYARINERRLKRLDFEARRPGFDKLAKSTKTVVEIDGEAPITVADLAAELKKDLFHGVGPAVRDKKINRNKQFALEKILARRLLLKQGIDARLRETAAFRDQVHDRRVALIVGSFIATVIAQEVKLTAAEIEDHYRTHLDDFMQPEFVRIDSMGFETAAAAADAAQALTEGNDWEWLRANADGLAAADKQVLPNSDRPLTMEGLPESLATAFASAKPGAISLYEGPQEVHYVVRLVQRLPARARAFAEVRSKIARELFDERVKQALADWSAKLREVYSVRTYLQSVDTKQVPVRDDEPASATEPGLADAAQVSPPSPE